MKNYLKALIAFLLVFVLAFAFVSCNFGGESTDPPAGDDTNGETEEDEGYHDNEYRLRFVYSYTAIVTNINNREEHKKSIVTVGSYYIPKDNDGITEELLAQINGLTYHGYSFVNWYNKADWDFETQSGIKGKAIDFASFGKITEDVTFYGDREDLVGPNANWSITFANRNGEPIDITTVDSGKYPDGKVFRKSDVRICVLTISGSGDMFDFQNPDVIDLPWYNYREMVTKIVFEDGITSVGDNSFSGMKQVKEVVFNDDITDIGMSAFAGCSNTSWRALKTPDSLKTIGTGAFTDNSFVNVVLNDGLVSIGDNAFYGTTKMNTIVVPTSLKSIGIAAFNPGKSSGATIDKVYYKGTPDDYKNLVVYMDNMWFNEFPVTYYYAEDEEVGNTGYIGEDGSIKPCWHYAEANGELTTTPVQYCYTISYKLPSEKLTFVSHYVPVSPVLDENGDVEVNDDGIPKLQGVITADIIKLRDELTYHNMKFVGFKKVGTAPETLNEGDAITEDIIYDVDRGNILSDGGGIIWSYDADKGVLTISKNAKAPEGASFEMWNFVDALDTGSLWTGGFSSLSKITSLVIEDGVESIGSYAFTNITSITDIVIPSSVKSVAPNAFDGCAGLLNIYYMGNDVVTECEGIVNEDGSSALTGVRATVYNKTDVPVSTPGYYWMEIVVSKKLVKRICWSIVATETVEGENVVYSNGALKIGGDKVMYDFEHAETTPWYGARSYITSVSFVNNIERIGENVVNGYSGISSISIPPSVLYVPESAFAGTGIVNDYSKYTKGFLVIDGVLIKASPAILNNTLVETFNGITVIANGAFKNCDAIKRLYIAATVQNINNGAFPDSEIEYVFYDGGEAGWTGISADSGMTVSNAVYYRSDENIGTDNKHWHKVGDEYAVWGCVHRFGEWNLVKASTCSNPGSQIRYCAFDSSHTETEDLPLDETAHVLVPKETDIGGYEITAATCDSDATMTYVCTNLTPRLKKCPYTEQIPIKEGEEGYEKALGHSFGHYYPDNNKGCVEDGTMTAFCTRCKVVSDTITDPNNPSYGGHDLVDWICEREATCLEDAIEYRYCQRCIKEDDNGTLIPQYEERVVVEGSHLTAAHDYVEIISPAYFDKYQEAEYPLASFFKSCSVCGVKSPFTFEYSTASYYDFEDSASPVEISGHNFVPKALNKGGWSIIVEDSNGNKYLQLKKLNGDLTPSIKSSNAFFDEVDTLVYSFDFKFEMADKLSNRIVAEFMLRDSKNKLEIAELKADKTTKATKITWYGKTFTNKADWVNITYKLTKAPDNSGYYLTVLMGGEAVLENKLLITKEVPYLFLEGAARKNTSYPNDFAYGIDNLVIAAYNDGDYAYDNENCLGKHDFGAWESDGKQDCENFGTLYRVCQKNGCNAVESTFDADGDGEYDLPALGTAHVWKHEDENDTSSPEVCEVCGKKK